MLTSGAQMLRVHLTKADAKPEYVGELDELREAVLVLNARVALPPKLKRYSNPSSL